MTRKYTKDPGHFMPTRPVETANTVEYLGPARNFFLRICRPSEDFVYRSREVQPYTVVACEDYLTHLDTDLKQGNLGIKKMQQHLEYIFSNLSAEGVSWVTNKLFGGITDAGKHTILSGMYKNNMVSEAISNLYNFFESAKDETGEYDLLNLKLKGFSEEDITAGMDEILSQIYNTLELNRRLNIAWGLDETEEWYNDPTLLQNKIWYLTDELVRLKNTHKQVQLWQYCQESLKRLEEQGLIVISPPEFLPEPTVGEINYD